MQKSYLKFNLLLIVLPLLLPGLLVAAWRSLFRTMAEQKNIYVETVVDFEEMRQLSREEGWKLPDLFAEIRKNGASSVAISEDTLASLESEGRITVLSAKEIRKLSLDEGLRNEISIEMASPGALWIHAEDCALLDRIEQHLGWKISSAKLVRLHRNFLLVNKSARLFRERVGLGFSDEYFDLAQQAGLGVVVRVFNYPELYAPAAARIMGAIPSPASVSALLFAEEEMLGNRGDLKGVIELFKNRSYRIGWIEFNTQEGIEDYLHGLSASRPFVRVHSISRKEIDQIYNVNRAVARWVRAVKDRSMKMLYIRCFFQDDQRYIADLVKFNLAYLKRIESSLRAAGFAVAGNFEQRIHEPRHMVGTMSPSEMIAIALALMLGLPLLIRFSFVKNLDERWFFIVALLTIAGFFTISRSSFIGIAGLIGAFSYSTLGVVLALSRLEEERFSLFSCIKYYLTMILPSLVGGILIAGLYSEIEYLLKFEQFRGIKLAFILPVLWIFFWSLKQYGRGFLAMLNRPLTPLMAVLATGALFAVVVYILRSGNLTIVKPSALEDSFRTFLENTLIARPRNKEFLIGYPAAALMMFFSFRKCFTVLPLLAIFVQMGQVSVVNSLCHFHTPLTLSLLRIFNGLWLGMLFAIPAAIGAAFVWLLVLAGSPKKNQVLVAGYLGFGNYGDELLWQTFSSELQRKFPQLEIKILLGQPRKCPHNWHGVLRSEWYRLHETIFTSRALIFPGGGVLQSETSLKSLVYYSYLIALAKLAGAKVLLPGQGIGPWGKSRERFSGLFSIFAELFETIDYLTVRDEPSRDYYEQLLGFSPKVSADMAFLNSHISVVPAQEAKTDIKLAVVLRNSVPESEKICRIFLEIAKEVENLTIIPVVFQSEDEQVWLRSGWEGELATAFAERPDVFEDADLVVSMRLHGCIVACAKAIPWLGIAYDPKVSGFAEACNWKFCFKPEEIDRAFIENQLNLLAVKRADYSLFLARKANEMSRRAVQDFESAIAFLN